MPSAQRGMSVSPMRSAGWKPRLRELDDLPNWGRGKPEEGTDKLGGYRPDRSGDSDQPRVRLE